MTSSAAIDPIVKLRQLAREYQQARAVSKGASPDGSARRRAEALVKALGERFESTLVHWVPDEGLREQWRGFFYRGAAAPGEPRFEVAPLFRGRSEDDAVLEVLEADDGGHDLFIDGVLVKHRDVPWHFDVARSGLSVDGEKDFDEVFDVDAAAARALRDYLETGAGEPPWQWARQLYEEGLVDTDFSLTTRGQRWFSSVAGASLGEGRAVYCVVVVNAARSRVFVLNRQQPDAPTSLVEVGDAEHPPARLRDQERFTDSRPGLRREGPHAPRHGVSDRRDSHKRRETQHFMRRVIQKAEEVWDQFERCTVVVVASPRILGALRPLLIKGLRYSKHRLVELPGDYTKLPAPSLHRRLADLGVLPRPGRQPPRLPMRTPNPWQRSK
jgi:hypothetical protein